MTFKQHKVMSRKMGAHVHSRLLQTRMKDKESLWHSLRMQKDPYGVTRPPKKAISTERLASAARQVEFWWIVCHIVFIPL